MDILVGQAGAPYLNFPQTTYSDQYGGGSFNARANPTNEAGIELGDGLVRVTVLADVRLSQAGSAIGKGGTHDYGRQIIGDHSDAVFTLSNFVDTLLNVTTPLTVTGTHPADFTIVSQPSATVVAFGGTTTFTVRFSPSEAGARSAVISIAHGNAAETPFELALTGEGLSPSLTGTTVPGSGAGVEATAAVCGFTAAGFASVDSIPTPPPENLPFDNGLFNFALSNCDVGGTASVSIDYGSELPEDLQCWKYGATADNPEAHWYRVPAFVAGSTVTFELVDGGLGDADLTANGSITDPGGPALFVAEPVPATSAASLAISSTLLALLAMLFLARNARELACPLDWP